MDSAGEIEARILSIEQHVLRLTKAARAARTRSVTVAAYGQAEAAERFELAARYHMSQLASAEQQLDGLRRALRAAADQTAESLPPAPERTQPSVFISYSRHDYYAAESLHSALVAGGEVRPWLDVAELDLGGDWAQAIEAALNAVDVFVLVSSPAAMTSQHVAREWRAAAARGLPIVVAAAAWTRPEPDLNPVAVHDLRSNFDQASRDVSRSILAAVNRRYDLPCKPVSRTYWPPLPILSIQLFIVANLLVTSLALACAATAITSPLEPVERIDSQVIGTGTLTFSGPAAYGPLLLCIAGMVTMGADMAKVVRRRFKPTAFCINVLYNVALLAFIALLVHLLDRRRILAPIDLPAPVGFALSIGPTLLASVAVLSAAAVVAALGSTDVLRITLTGYHLTHVRRRITAEEPGGAQTLDMFQSAEDAAIAMLSGRAMLGDPKRRTFRLWHDPEDEGCAATIRKACTAAGLTERHDGYWWIHIISNLTNLDRLSDPKPVRASQQICVLATSVAIPEDAEILRRLQWLDFRRHDVSALESLLRGLTSRGSNVKRLPVPINPSQFRPSGAVLGATYNPLVFLGVATAIATSLTLTLSGEIIDIWSIAIAAAFSVLCAKISAGIASRTYTMTSIRRDGFAWIASLVCCVATLLVVASPSLAVSIAYLLAMTMILFQALVLFRSLKRWWLLTKPHPGARARLPQLDQYRPMLIGLFGLTLAVITAVRVPPKPELYLSTGADQGTLYPISALPESIPLTNHDVITGLHWADVTLDRATGQGDLNQINCVPNCAEGTYTATKVEVVAADPQECEIDVFPDYTDYYYTLHRTIFTSVTARTPSGELIPYSLGEEINSPRCPGD